MYVPLDGPIQRKPISNLAPSAPPRSPTEQITEFRVSRIRFFVQALVFGSSAAAAWYVFDRLLPLQIISWPLSAFLAFEAFRALVQSLFYPPFNVVRIAPDWIFGPGRGSGVQITTPKEHVTGLARSRGRLIVQTKDHDPIIVRLRLYGHEAEDLVRAIERWYGRAAV